jgi:hypothetical protein
VADDLAILDGGDDNPIARMVIAGLCPNLCGMLIPAQFGQQCTECGFFTNTKQDQQTTQ